MFSRDAKLIADSNDNGSPAVAFGAYMLAVLSVQQPFWRIEDMIFDVADNGAKAVSLWGWKRDAFAYGRANADKIQEVAKAARRGDISHESLVLALLDAPGLGLAKASFVAQMLTQDGACLDVHNLRKLEKSPLAFRLPKTLKEKGKISRVKEYVSTWKAVGDSEYWWNSWCYHVASQSTRTITDSGDKVSWLHQWALLWEKEGIAID